MYGAVDRAVRIRLIKRLRRISRQIGTSHYAQDNATILDSGQGDRVLLSAQKPLRPVDRIERPVGVPASIGVVIAGIDRVEHFVCRDVRSVGVDRCHYCVEHGCMFIAAQFAGMLLAHDPHLLVDAMDRHRYDRLNRKVGHGDGASIILGDFTDLRQILLDRAGHPACVTNRTERC